MYLAACTGSPAELPPSQTGEVAGSTWVLGEGEGPAGPVLTDDARVTLHVDEERDQLGGVSGCNEYGAQLSLDGDTIEVGGFSGTAMACERAVMEVERRYLEALQAVDTLAVDGDRLELSGPDTTLIFDRRPDAPTDDLVGTRWRLESVIEGEGAAASPSGDPAELRIGDGTLTLETSCVRAEADWVERGAEFRITSSAYDYADRDAACLHEDAEQQRIVEVFDGAFTAAVEDGVLTLRATRSDTALRFRATD